MSNKSLEVFKSKINFNDPDECDVIRAIYFEADTITSRGFLDVFSEDEIFQMFNSDGIWIWSQRNRDWLVQTVQNIIESTPDKH